MFPPLALVTAFLLVRLDLRTLMRLLWPLVVGGAALTVLVSSPSIACTCVLD